MNATLRPKRESATTEYAEVELLGRTGNRKIRIRRRSPDCIYAVDRFYLYDPSRRRRLTDAEFAVLPWQGKGPDPEMAAGRELLPSGGTL